MTIGNVRFLLVAFLAVVVTACSGSTDTKPPDSLAAADKDNTAINERDQSPAAQTPLDQGENQQDLEISSSIRKAVVADDSLSTNAHNVKIITNAGVVTLRGPVKSAQEKMTIEAKAKAVTGVTRIDNLLEVEAVK